MRKCCRNIRVLCNNMGRRKLVCVILLGLAFLLVFASFQTLGNIEKTILASVHQDDPSFNGNAYTSLAIIYIVFAFCNWFVPSVISVIGPKWSMLLGAIAYAAFIMSFLKPITWLLYTMSVVIGIGAALIWTGQGNYLTLNSSPATISRNSGIFWAMLQLSMFIGNLFVYIKFRGLEHIDESLRNLVVWVLSGLSIAGIVTIIILPKVRIDPDSDIADENLGPYETLKSAVRLLLTKRMLLLSVTFLYTGLELGFFSGVYSSSIGFTTKFGDQAKELVGLSGIFVGVGEVLGGALFGILGAKFTRWGRDPIVIVGYVLHVVAFFSIFVNLPNSSPFDSTDEDAFIQPNAILAMFCSFLLGFGDSCFNTQVYSMLGGEYPANSASAFAIFKFTQSVASAICFFYASALGLYVQLGILLVLATIGTVTFVVVEWAVKKEKREGSPQKINVSDGSSSTR